MLAAEKLGGVLINAQHNFSWLTCGGSNGIDLSRANGSCFVLVRADGRRFLIANRIEMPRLLAEEVSEEDFEPVELSWQEEKASFAIVVSTAKSLLEGDSPLGSDMLMADHLRDAEPQISACRYSFTDAEIGRYRTLGRDTGRLIGEALSEVCPGETESQIAAKVRAKFWEAGSISVVTLVGADDRIGRFRHPVPTENIWRKTLLVAVCARRQGLIACLSRIVCVGDVPGELQRRTQIVAEVNARLYAATRPGATGAELYLTAETAYADLGFAREIDNHHQGGACGYRTRDWTALPTSSETVRMHQAFAWNPSLTGTKVEETGIVTADGFEGITSTPGFPQISTVVDGREYLSPGVLSISKGASA